MIRLRTACLAGLLACAGGAPGRAQALDLAGALREVAAANPTLAARRARVEAAERRVAPAGAWPSPMVELGAINVPTTGRFDQEDMTMKMVGVSQRVPIFGSNRLSRRAAAAAVAAERAEATSTGYELFGMAWEAYAEAFHAGERARGALGHQGVVDRMVRAARARYESGGGRLEDVLRAESERARVLVDLAAYRGEERAARARLDALRGVVPGGPADTLAPVPAFEVPADPAAWLAAVVPAHPRLREMSAQVEHYRFAARAARRRAWPDLELKGSYGFREPMADGMRRENMYSASVAFMLPVFAAQREFSEGAEMDAMARAGDSERRAAELELMQQVSAAHASAAAAQRTVTLLADTVIVLQRRALEASWVAYSGGTTDLWRVLEASHALYDQEIALTRSRQDLARAQAALLALTGRGDLLGLALPAIERSEP